jgi:chemotaxis signal transduction protein/chemotaxis regulatin CheY-phosphate phosphatase CheZ
VLQYIGFRLQSGEYGIPITKIREIVNLPLVTSLPQSPAYLRGVTNLRGNVIPLVNLKKLINIPETEGGGTKVIVIVNGKLTFGILVDGITGVLSVDESKIESPEGLSHSHAEEIAGVAKLDGRLVVLLDTNKLIPLSDLSLLEEVVAEVRDSGTVGTVEVTRTVQSMAGEIKVKELHDAREYFEKNKNFTGDDPRREIFEDIAAFMNAVQNQDYEKADMLMQHVAKTGQGDLFKEVGKITRRLHDTIRSFKEALDPRLKGFAQADIPTAVDKLQFVIDKTEEAANKTMSVVEKYIVRMEELAAHIRKVEGPPETAAYLKEFKNGFEDDLTEILTTQSFQDLTGQTIKKVITLVGDIETELVRLVASFGVKVEPGAHVTVPAAEKVSQAGVDDLLKEFGF